MDYDQTEMARGYDSGRGYSAAQLDRWLAVIARAVSRDSLAAILDLGCGTGRYSGALAERFRARVVGVDPSVTMLAEARRKSLDNVDYVRACAEALPLKPRSFGMVFISMVFHHFDDAGRAIAECRRVLRGEGAVCLRASTIEQIERYAYVPFFPETRAIIRRTLMPRESIEAAFIAGGFAVEHHQIVCSEVAANWSDYAERLVHRADSILVQLADREFDEGLRRLRDHAAAAAPDQQVVEPVDFFAFRSVAR